jgi:non-ribosomal peptide synthetase component E (peptide arylation enzyme)
VADLVKHAIDGVVYPSHDRAQTSLRNGSWLATTVGDALRQTALRYPSREALISDEGVLTFEQLNDDTERLACALLNLGLVPGDRAIFQLGTTLETALVLLACYKAGIVPVCSLPQHREIEIGQLAQQSGAKAYFVQADFSDFDLVGFARSMAARFEDLQHVVVVRGQSAGLPDVQALVQSVSLQDARQRLLSVVLGYADVLSFQLSGGTTGVPKIIPRFHAEYLGHSAAWARGYKIDNNSRVIWCVPLLHNAGQLYALMPMLTSGVTTVLMPKVDIQRMLVLIEMHRVTHAMSIGPIAPQLLVYEAIDSHDLSSLQLFATMSRADKLEAHLKVPCSNLFGITEGLLLGAAGDAPPFVRHHTQGSSGCPFDEIRLLDPESEQPVVRGHMGELCFRGPSSLTGFYRAGKANETAFTSDGFYRTGDMMTAHEVDGITCYTFEGRLRDNINRGGEKIGCEEVEGFVSQHPDVADAKLVAMPDPMYGERGCIFIIPRKGKTAPDVKALAAFLSERGLAKYKCPERVEVCESFPVTRVGKLDKPALKKEIADKLAHEQRLGPR